MSKLPTAPLALVPGLLLAIASPRASLAERSEPLALRSFLDPDGQLDLPPGFRGSLDPAGLELATADAGRPRFRPVGAAATRGTATGVEERWSANFAPTGCNGVIHAVAVAASGEVYVGGLFTRCGGAAAHNVARYDPETWAWSPLGGGGEGVNGRVTALAVAGEDLYVGGSFTEADVGAAIAANHIARWDGAGWSALGSGGGNGVDHNVLTLAVLGPDLYVGGNFLTANVGDPITVNRIARWDGAAWSALGSSGGAGVSSNVFALAVVDSDLYVGGAFTQANLGAPIPANFVARWDGVAWSALDSGTGNGVSGAVSALAFSGGDLIVGGGFLTANQGAAPITALRIARWSGQAWSALGSEGGNGFDGPVTALVTNGGDLYAAGSFTQANLSGPAIAAHRVARWNGTTWSALGGGAGEGTDGSVGALAVSAGLLYVGGGFERANLGGDEVLADRIAAWDGGGWSTVGPLGGLAPFTTPPIRTRIYAVAVDGDDLYLGGLFRQAGGVAANNLVRYHRPTHTWSALGTGAGNGTDNAVRALLVDGTDLYVGGEFTAVNSGDPITANRLARWDGTGWSALGSGGGEGLDQRVHALARCGGALYAGGDFSQANVGAPVAANRIARWDGASWSALGSGGGNGVSSSVFALACSGGDLFVGGTFIQANQGAPIEVNRIARWNGASWSALGSDGGAGVNASVFALAVLGSDLFVGGQFTQANVGAALAANRIARWDGWTWSVLGSAAGSGLDNTVNALAVSGWDLYVGGDFSQADGGAAQPASRVAHWTGGGWAPMGSGTDLPVRALALVSADEIAVGGDFDRAGDQPSSRFGLYRARGTLTVFLDGGPGRVTSSPNGIACPGTCSTNFAWDVPITLTAIPDPGYRLEAWAGGGCGGTGPCVLSLAGDTGVVATFGLDPRADLAIELSDLADPPAPGDPVFYTARVDNLAPLLTASGVVVTSTLPAGLTLVATQGCLEDPIGLPTCTLGNLAAGASASFSLQASVDPGAPATVLHQACVAGADPDPDLDNNCDSEPTLLDGVGPTVVRIDSLAGSGDGAVVECETVRAEVVAFQVTFSEPVAAADAADPASATNPDNYRLVAAAPGAGFDTAGCLDAPGGDQVIAIAGVSWDAGDLTATVTRGSTAALRDGLYRLIVCGALEDEAGNALDGGAGAGSDFARTFRIDARNLLAGGHFDRFDPLACTLDAWTRSNLAEVEIAAEDVGASPLSGAAHNTAPSAGFDLRQCVALAANQPYLLRAAVRVDESAGDPILAELACEMNDGAACGGNDLATSSVSANLSDSGTAWGELRLDFLTPPGTVSARCGLTADPGAAIAFEAYFDDVFLGPRLLFADGFESGDTGAWAITVP